MNETYVSDIISVSNAFFICAKGGGVYISTDNGVTWISKNNGLTTFEARSCFDIDLIYDKFYLATVDGIFVSSDQGESWLNKSNGITIGPGATKIFAYSIFENNGRLFTGVHNGLYFSDDFGENWQLSNISGSHINVVSFINFNGTLFAGRDSGNPPPAYRSTGGGLVWEPVNIWNNFPVSSFCFFSEQDTLFAGGLGMFVSIDNGLNWTERSNGLSPDPYVSSIAKSGNTMIASLMFGGSGMFKTTDNGFNWISIEDNLPFLSEIRKILIHNDHLYITTSKGIWKRPLNEILTGINSTAEEIPSEFYLGQNYPNPFNPETTIEFVISPQPKIGISSAEGRLGLVSLKVYNALGKEVATILNEVLTPGKYIYKYSTVNHQLSSGIYFYRLTNGEYTDTKRMILLK